MKKIKVLQISFPKPEFKNSFLSKEKIVQNWLVDWINSAIDKGEIQYGSLIPKKSELAAFLNVSTGTVQNAIRRLEDLGIFESKQSIGTLVCDPNSAKKTFEKMLSKKDKTVTKIKHYIIENKIKPDTPLPCVTRLCSILEVSDNTLRHALETLEADGTLFRQNAQGNRVLYIYKNKIDPQTLATAQDLNAQNFTLINKTTQKIKDYIMQNCNVGDKIPTNDEFSKMFEVSIRTVNEATRVLNEEKIILSRRGRYGTIFLNDPQKIRKQKEREEKSLYMSPTGSSGQKAANIQNSYLYTWETTLDALKKFIIQNHETGDKIPSMKQLADILNVSTNTVKRAVSILCEEGYLIAQRGKYGGVFILEMPQKEAEAFTWLALNPEVVKINK